jgi:hypothetical protein
MEIRFNFPLDRLERSTLTENTPTENALMEPGERRLQDCSYRNSSDRMVVLRCCGSQHFFLERVVFPFELLAEASPEAPAFEPGAMFPSPSASLRTTPWLQAS